MKNKKGFTLTEILLAVMIVGIIGVALAALTTAASRESGVGRSKVLLRNNLSIMLRQLRRDVQESSRVLYARGNEAVPEGTLVPLLMLGKNTDQGTGFYNSGSASHVVYCFQRGSKTITTSGKSVVPEGADDGGIIYRFEDNSGGPPPWNGNVPACSNRTKVLNNVKYLNSANYVAPSFSVRGIATGRYNVKTNPNIVQKNLGSILDIQLITELPSNPVVNDVTEETFVLPNGFNIK